MGGRIRVKGDGGKVKGRRDAGFEAWYEEA
jgi:hypothetical protein